MKTYYKVCFADWPIKSFVYISEDFDNTKNAGIIG